MNVLLTGGNGFIGSVVARMLVSKGHSVTCLLREGSNLERIAKLPFLRATGDVRDAQSVRAAMASCECTIHMAAPGAWEQEDPATLGAVLEGGTRNVVTAAGELQAHRVVVVSSAAAIAASDRPTVFNEDTPFTMPDRTLHYAFAKHRAERVAMEAHERGLSVVIVNPAEVYGENDTTLVTAGNLMDFATSTPVLVCRGGTCVVHVDDVAAGIIAALERGRSGQRYILGAENLTIRQLAALVLELVDRRAIVLTVPNRVVRFTSRAAINFRIPLPFNPHVAPYATWYWLMDSAKSRRELGVTYRSARETISATLAWLEATHRMKARKPRL